MSTQYRISSLFLYVLALVLLTVFALDSPSELAVINVSKGTTEEMVTKMDIRGITVTADSEDVAQPGNNFLVSTSTKESSDTKQWQSLLFPKEGDHYCFQNISGFELPDFSHAGYHGGEKSIPDVSVIKTISPIHGDNTSHIQKSINESAGGALLLKPGTYRVTSQIVVPANTVLKGSGPNRTFIFVDSDNTKDTSVLVGGRSRKSVPGMVRWNYTTGDLRIDIIHDVYNKDDAIIVAKTHGLSVGDWIVVKNEVTDDFRIEYNNTTQVNGKPIWPNDNSAIKFLRKIKDINENTITLDCPVRHTLKRRDNPHILKVDYMAEEIGVEDLSIGFKNPIENLKYHSLSSNGHEAPYHASRSILFGNVKNGWIRNVKSYSPLGNGVHIHSCGISLSYSRNITVTDCDLGYPANIGIGGNGYLFIISMSNDCLIQNCTARQGRHNYIFHYTASGNVISNCVSIDSQLPNDFHHSLAVSNLIENMVISSNVDKYAFEVKDRGTISFGAGETGADNVFWKINMTDKNHHERTSRIHSEQSNANGGKGYVIGATHVAGNDTSHGSEWREGIGREKGLRPISLYREQLRLRLHK